MKVKVLGSTHENYIATKEEFDRLSGHSAGICYMANDIDTLFNEPIEKTIKRAESTKARAHHSVFGHAHINLSLEGIPKALAMVLNNEGIYNTSEKSARYTKMVLQPNEQKLYDKWLNKYKELISLEYQDKYPEFFTASKIEKLAQENARYLISTFTNTTMEYTVSYQQLNYLYKMMKNEAEAPKNAFMEALKPAMCDFCKEIENLGYVDEELAKGVDVKHRALSLITTKQNPEKYFGDVYSVSYQGSFAQLAQAQRHRTTFYNFSLLPEHKFFIPPIIKNNKDLVAEWLNDCESLAEFFPQGMLININEYGRFDTFVQKMKERKCTFAQLEINIQTTALVKEYATALKLKNHPRAKEMEQYTHGARCTFPDFNCPAPCGFKEGVLETRII